MLNEMCVVGTSIDDQLD